MITIRLIKHLSTGEILIMALASVGIKSILKSVSILLNQELRIFYFSYFHFISIS